jgi:uncharacterized protein
MPRKPRVFVLDSWAVLAYLGDEQTGQEVADIIASAQDQGTVLTMSIVNAGEVWYILAREASEIEADGAVTNLRQLGIQLVDADWKLTRLAGAFKARYRMSYADCFAAALAKDNRAELLTGDKEFEQVTGEIKIAWLRSP